MPTARPNLSIIPWPAEVTLTEGEFAGSDSSVVLTSENADPSLGEEGYELHVTPVRITVRAPKPAGLFYGAQTLRQLRAGPTIPALRIVDRPRFGWRGLMLDEARHFFGKEFVKRFIDLLALHKLNVFHWHLCDDQGWRIEIKKHPRLTEVGAWRSESPLPNRRDEGDGVRYGGFYTQADIREVVAYAASRFVTVMPEIEMPGHSTAALAAYPQFSCSGGPLDVATRWHADKGVYCAGNDETFTFLEDVLAEVLALFPSRFIHVGGDECPKDHWRACPKCQARINAESLRDEDGLQSYFIGRIERFLNAHDRRLIGWDEIQEGGLSPTATMMVWRDWKWARLAIERGNDVVMAPRTHTYFDYYQRDPNQHDEPEAIGGLLPLETVYSFEPIPPALDPAQHHHVLGGQGQLWSEFLFDSAKVEYMAFPRACALSEALWSPREARDFSDFSSRLAAHQH